MFRHLVAMVLVAFAVATVSPAGAQAPPPGTAVGTLTCKMAPTIGLILGIAATVGMPLHSQRFLPARGLCRCHGDHWSRCRHHCRRRPGVGRICACRRSNAWKACRHLRRCKRLGERWRWRWCQPPVRRNRPFDSIATAFSRRIGRGQPVSWSFKSHPCPGTMRESAKSSVQPLVAITAATPSSRKVRSQSSEDVR